MCIRDSGRTLVVLTGDEGRANDVALSADVEAKADGVLRACLLYTSDAADERSSVDLGGRRIIKKKKK